VGTGSGVDTHISATKAVAPIWHTIVVLLLVLGFSLAGALSENATPVSAHGRSMGYLLIMIFEWVTVGFIWLGIRLRGVSIAELIGGAWPGPKSVFRDIGLAIGFLIVSGLVLNSLGFLLKVRPNQALRNLIPQSSSEVIVYLLLTATAGFCEEIIFRGYFQRQFSALTGTAAGGVLLQGLIFGAAHGYQGWKFMMLIAVFGCLFGLLAFWRRSLRPGVVAHFLQDGIGGLLARHLML
jgi:membrane protease YdiL (CAAX protease family)